MEVKTKFSPLSKLAAVATVYALTASAHADTISDLTDTVDFSSVQTGVLAISGSLISLFVVVFGAALLVQKVRGR